MKKIRNPDVPTMSQQEIREQADNSLFNGVGFAIAQAGLVQVNELARLIDAEPHQDNVLETVQNILGRFSEMRTTLDLNTDNTFVCTLRFSLHRDNNVVDFPTPGGHTIQ